MWLLTSHRKFHQLFEDEIYFFIFVQEVMKITIICEQFPKKRIFFESWILKFADEWQPPIFFPQTCNTIHKDEFLWKIFFISDIKSCENDQLLLPIYMGCLGYFDRNFLENFFQKNEFDQNFLYFYFIFTINIFCNWIYPKPVKLIKISIVQYIKTIKIGLYRQ